MKEAESIAAMSHENLDQTERGSNGELCYSVEPAFWPVSFYLISAIFSMEALVACVVLVFDYIQTVKLNVKVFLLIIDRLFILVVLKSLHK